MEVHAGWHVAEDGPTPRPAVKADASPSPKISPPLPPTSTGHRPAESSMAEASMHVCNGRLAQYSSKGQMFAFAVSEAGCLIKLENKKAKDGKRTRDS